MFSEAIQKYIIENKRGKFYHRAVSLSNEHKKTFGKEYPDYLEKLFKKDSKDGKEFRKENYLNLFQGFVTKVSDSIASIKQSNGIVYELSGEGDTYFSALTEKIQSFLFNELAHLYIQDANSYFCIVPECIYNPKTKIEYFPCNNILFSGHDLCVIQSYETIPINDQFGKKIEDGKVYYLFSKENFTIVRHIGYDNKEKKIDILTLEDGTFPLHGNSFIPCIKVGNPKNIIELDLHTGESLHHSIMYFMENHVRLAQKLLSNWDIEGFKHVYSKLWMIINNPCPLTKEKICENGRLTRNYTFTGISYKQLDICPSCKGQGHIYPVSGQEIIQITPQKDSLDGKLSNAPIPPMGYVEKSIDIFTVLYENIKDHIKNAWDEIGMRFMYETPIIQSGIAKAFDRQPTYEWKSVQCEHFLNNIADPVLRSLLNIHFKDNPTKINDYTITIKTPISYEPYSEQTLIDSIKEIALVANDIGIKNSFLLEFIGNRYSINSYEYKILLTKIELQPLYGYSNAELLSFKDTISKEEYLLAVRFDEAISDITTDRPELLNTENKSVLKELLYQWATKLQEKITKNTVLNVAFFPIVANG